LDIVDQVRDLLAIDQIAIMQKQPRLRLMHILIDMLDTVRIKRTGAADNAVDLIAFGEHM
jgi:hypothetical protein